MSDDWRTVSIMAVSSLSSVTSTATEVGHVEIALSSNHAQELVLRILRSNDPEDVNDVVYDQLKIVLTRLSKRSDAEGPQTQAFTCLAEFEPCWESASSKVKKAVCLVTFAACLAHGLTNLFGD